MEQEEELPEGGGIASAESNRSRRRWTKDSRQKRFEGQGKVCAAVGVCRELQAEVGGWKVKLRIKSRHGFRSHRAPYAESRS